YNRKPDAVLVEEQEMGVNSWGTFQVIAEWSSEPFTLTWRIAKTINTKAYLVLRSQPWHRYVLAFSFAALHLRVHAYNHSGCVITPPIHIHNDPDVFIHILGAVVFGDLTSLGHDQTLVM
ncbi:hypothetical protein L210DRAFT_786103, partial [Boletus edulis BED1]